MKHLSLLAVCLFSLLITVHSQDLNNPYLVVLGTAQDGGYPHPDCKLECCIKYYQGKESRHYVSSLAIIDPISKERFLFDCTPDFTMQLHHLDSIYPVEGKMMDAIFLTHAHIGHYAGLMYLGKEAMNTKHISVYGTADLMSYLSSNGPWSQLQTLENVNYMSLPVNEKLQLNERITITPILVPHRDEFSKTVCYEINMGKRTILYIPVINKWEKWDHDIVKMIHESDLLFIDGTFLNNGELQDRDMSEIPHPFIAESLKLFKDLSNYDKSKIHFIHLNHTNPALINGSKAQKEIESKGFHVAHEFEIY
ncbi:MAG: MBL fold metallo-hydrolase [Bacteroidota bacterium]